MILTGIKRFEGEATIPNLLNANEAAEIPGLAADLTKKYGVTLTIDGDECYVTSTVETLLGDPVTCLLNDGVVVLMAGNNAGYIGNNEHEVVIKEIYEIGKADNYVTENGFELWKNNSGKWCLVGTPNTDYVVPHTVAGVTVDVVYMDSMRGNPTFDKSYALSNMTDPASFEFIKVKTTDYQFIFEGWFTTGYLDLSECGDDVQIPEEYLTGGYSLTTIYVSPAVKENYSAYDNVVAK